MRKYLLMFFAVFGLMISMPSLATSEDYNLSTALFAVVVVDCEALEPAEPENPEFTEYDSIGSFVWDAEYRREASLLRLYTGNETGYEVMEVPFPVGIVT